jgi:hypothetical protein
MTTWPVVEVAMIRLLLVLSRAKAPTDALDGLEFTGIIRRPVVVETVMVKSRIVEEAVDRSPPEKVLRAVIVWAVPKSTRVIVPEGNVASVVPEVVRVKECPPARISEALVGIVRVPAELDIVRPFMVVTVKALNVGEAVVLTDWSNQLLRVGAPVTVKAKPLTFKLELNRLVEEALVANEVVEVALVEVASPVFIEPGKIT